MSHSKSFNICVVLNVLDVTCPGVCICPKGMVCLKIGLFEHNSITSYVEPKFPLVFNETISFHENFAESANLKDLQKRLEEKCMHIALLQVYKNKQVTLATFKSNVDDVLYPERSRLSRKGEMALLMQNEPLFPGTISPKITLVTKTSVTEQINAISNDDLHCSETRNRPNRTKWVHHTKPVNSECFQKRGHRTSPDKSESCSDSESETDSHLYCYKTTKIANVMNCGRHLKQTCKHCKSERFFREDV